MALIAAGETITDASGKLRAGRIADNAVDTDQLADDAVGSAEIGENIELTGNYLKLPSGNTAGRPSGAAGIIRYNSELNRYEQYDETAEDWIKWAELTPTITSLTYPGDDTALDTAGSQTLIITGTNYESGLTVTIDGTAPSSVTINSATQLTCTGTPAKSAGTKTNGVVVTSLAGLTASIDVNYSALPDWQTSNASAVLDAYNSTISTIDLDATDATSYAITSGALPTGLSMNATTGDLTGTMNASAATYNFTVTAEDAQNQSAARAFSIISKGTAPTGGSITTPTIGGQQYRVHTFTYTGQNQTFTLFSTMSCDILIVGGGGGGGGSIISHGGAGGGGAGGTVFYPAKSLTTDGYTIVVGGGGDGGVGHGRGTSGNSSSFEGLTTASGGGGGGCGSKTSGIMTGLDGGCGGGAGWHDQNGARGRGVNNASNQGNHGGHVSQNGSGCDSSNGGAGGAGGGGAGGAGSCNGTLGGTHSGGAAGEAATEGTTTWHNFTAGTGTATVNMDGTGFTWGEGGDGGGDGADTGHRTANKGHGGHAIYSWQNNDNSNNGIGYNGDDGFVMVRYAI